MLWTYAVPICENEQNSQIGRFTFYIELFSQFWKIHAAQEKLPNLTSYVQLLVIRNLLL